MFGIGRFFEFITSGDNTEVRSERGWAAGLGLSGHFVWGGQVTLGRECPPEP